MGIAPGTASGGRVGALRSVLARLRDETYQKIIEFRRDQGEEAQTSPADELDAARSSTDVATHASLIERAEDRLRLIDEALARIDKGSYGICAECGDDIPLARLKALPFALFCVDCQQKRTDTRAKWGTGSGLEPFGDRWTPPAGVEEHEERTVRLDQADDSTAAHSDFAFEPEEEGEGEAPKRRRGRPRKNPPK